MQHKLDIVGGTYFEVCIEPKKERDLFGSGYRAAAALSAKGFDIELHSCISQAQVAIATSIAEAYGFILQPTITEKTVIFGYYHPLSIPECINLNEQVITLPTIKRECILYYGLVEAKAVVHGNYLVYDPQNQIPFSSTGSTANHLAMVMNRKEAYHLSGCPETVSLKEVARVLLASQGAEVVVIKDGSQGALVVDADNIYIIPVYRTETVWPIGSGDIFSAVFAWQWAINKKPPCDAALLASQFTATFCSNTVLPLTEVPDEFEAILPKPKPKKIYLAGPFFNIAQRWLVTEFRLLLKEFGNDVFSPYHDLGIVPGGNAAFSKDDYVLARKDLNAIQDAELIVAILCDHDPGTVFEIGYAKALGKEVLIYSENLRQEDLFMMVGSDCRIVSDFSTAIYAASW
jgi:nucleoside 2-deoxyribosyltransferase